MNDIPVLVREFADCVTAQSEAIASGDPDKGNEFARRYVRAFHSLRTLGDAGLDALAGLLRDERACVRITAAAFLLRHNGEEARRVLQTEAAGRGLLAFSAAQALQRWEDGTWNLDRE
jgi:hypothetical protein